jgi:hypothetical protein
MTRKHQSPEYQRNAKVVRTRAKAQLRAGILVPCWRCGHPIEGLLFDVGHIDPMGGERMTNLAPEHRYAIGGCRGNRSYGGSDGAAVTNSRRVVTKRSDVTTWPV